MGDASTEYEAILLKQEARLRRCENLLLPTNYSTMTDSHDNIFRASLTPDQVVVLLQETRNDIGEIKKILAPLNEWKSKFQGGINVLRILICCSLGGIGFLGWRVWDSQAAEIRTQIQQEAQSIKNNSLDAAIGEVRSSAISNGTRTATIENTLKDYEKDLADIKSRLSAVETGAITRHIK